MYVIHSDQCLFAFVTYIPGASCSKVGLRYPPDKSLSNGYVLGKPIALVHNREEYVFQKSELSSPQMQLYATC